MNSYQLTVVVKNDLDEKARGELLAGVTKQFGKLNKEDLWGNRDLSYPILKQTKAFYAHYEFEADPSTIFSLDKSLKLDEDVIRYLLIRQEIKKDKEGKKAQPVKEEKTTEAEEETKE